jgi:hypothetical protein
MSIQQHAHTAYAPALRAAQVPQLQRRHCSWVAVCRVAPALRWHHMTGGLQMHTGCLQMHTAVQACAGMDHLCSDCRWAGCACAAGCTWVFCCANGVTVLSSAWLDSGKISALFGTAPAVRTTYCVAATVYQHHSARKFTLRCLLPTAALLVGRQAPSGIHTCLHCLQDAHLLGAARCQRAVARDGLCAVVAAWTMHAPASWQLRCPIQ